MGLNQEQVDDEGFDVIVISTDQMVGTAGGLQLGGVSTGGVKQGTSKLTTLMYHPYNATL